MRTHRLPIRKLEQFCVKLPGTFKQVDVYTSTGDYISQDIPDDIPEEIFKDPEIIAHTYYEGSTILPIPVAPGQIMPHVLRFAIEAACVAEAFEKFDASAKKAAEEFFEAHSKPKIQVASELGGIITP